MTTEKIKRMVFGTRKMEMFLFYPETSEAVQEIRIIENSAYPAVASVVKNHLGNLCGYIRLPLRPFKEEGYEGFLSYIPVHGGITYAEQDEDGTMVYGVDYGHLCDMEEEGGIMDYSVNPPRIRFKKRTIDEVMFEVLRMYKALIAAIPYEERYEKTESAEEKAKIIDEYHGEMRKLQINFDLGNNMGAMLNLLCGRI